MILQKVILEMGPVKGTLKIPALPNFRSGDNRWTNFAPVNNATFQYVLQLELLVQRWKVTPKVSPPNLILLIFWNFVFN